MMLSEQLAEIEQHIDDRQGVGAGAAMVAAAQALETGPWIARNLCAGCTTLAETYRQHGCPTSIEGQRAVHAEANAVENDD